MDPLESFKVIKKLTSPIRRVSYVDEDFAESTPHKKLIIVIPSGHASGEAYIKKKASDLTRLVGMYGDDVIMLYNKYKKVKQNGDFSDGSSIRTTADSKRTDRRGSI